MPSGVGVGEERAPIPDLVQSDLAAPVSFLGPVGGPAVLFVEQPGALVTGEHPEGRFSGRRRPGGMPPQQGMSVQGANVTGSPLIGFGGVAASSARGDKYEEFELLEESSTRAAGRIRSNIGCQGSLKGPFPLCRHRGEGWTASKTDAVAITAYHRVQHYGLGDAFEAPLQPPGGSCAVRLGRL